MKKIISIDGGKGGTGKSVVAGAVIDTALVAGHSVLLIECDTSNPDVAKAYSESVRTLPICIDEREGFLTLASAIYEAAEDIIIINNPARSEKWQQFGGVIVENLARMDASMRVVWVANRQVDSVELCADFHTAFPSIPLFFCMNTYWGAAQKFETWNASKLRTKIFNAGGGEICFPDTADRVMHTMRNSRMKWDQINSMAFGDLIEAERVRKEFHAILMPLLS